ncbi:hypothetical protein ABXV18_24415 [Vibrio owensii]|uniref:hypothetical protein n=1 Tax=Vibrio owensii TaxID=696485 RepID=UPI00339B6CEA
MTFRMKFKLDGIYDCGGDKPDLIFKGGNTQSPPVSESSVDGQQILKLISDKEEPAIFYGEIFAVKPDSFAFDTQDGDVRNLIIYDVDGNEVHSVHLLGKDEDVTQLINDLKVTFPTENKIKGSLVSTYNGQANQITTAFRFNLSDVETKLVYTKDNGDKVIIERGTAVPEIKYAVSVVIISGTGERLELSSNFEVYPDKSSAQAAYDAVKDLMDDPDTSDCQYRYIVGLHETYHTMSLYEGAVFKAVNYLPTYGFGVFTELTDAQSNALVNEVKTHILDHVANKGYEEMFEKQFSYNSASLDDQYVSKVTIAAKKVFHYRFESIK